MTEPLHSPSRAAERRSEGGLLGVDKENVKKEGTPRVSIRKLGWGHGLLLISDSIVRIIFWGTIEIPDYAVDCWSTGSCMVASEELAVEG